MFTAPQITIFITNKSKLITSTQQGREALVQFKELHVKIRVFICKKTCFYMEKNVFLRVKKRVFTCKKTCFYL